MKRRRRMRSKRRMKKRCRRRMCMSRGVIVCLRVQVTSSHSLHHRLLIILHLLSRTLDQQGRVCCPSVWLKASPVQLAVTARMKGSLRFAVRHSVSAEECRMFAHSLWAQRVMVTGVSLHSFHCSSVLLLWVRCVVFSDASFYSSF